MRVAVHGFVLQSFKAGNRPHKGHGHIHFSLDGGYYDQPQFAGHNGRMALRLLVNGYYSPAYGTSITYHHIPPGHHTLVAALANRNDTPTGVKATVRFTVG